MDRSVQNSVGGAINNALCIYEQLGEIRMMVCNNDETIKVFSIPDFRLITTLSLTTAVNYGTNNKFIITLLDDQVSTSPDGTKMVAVGDSNQAFVYDIRPNGYSLIDRLTCIN